MKLALFLVILFRITMRMLYNGLVRVPRASAAFTTGNLFASPRSLQQQQVLLLQRCGLAGMSRSRKKDKDGTRQSPRGIPLLSSLPPLPPNMKVFKGDAGGRRSNRTSTPSTVVNNNNNNNTDNKNGPKVITNRPHQLRADRVLANRGWGSRSECFEVLKQKRVKVIRDGKYHILNGPSDRLNMNEAIWVDHKELPQIPLLLVYHKPKWVLSVMNDPKGRPCLASILPKKYQNQDLHPVGRLDYDTSGLLLFSSLGVLTQKLLHPTHAVPKQYMALVQGLVNQTELSDTLARGVETTEGTHTAELVDVQYLTIEDSEQVWQRVRDNLPPEYNVEELEDKRFLPDSTADPNSTTTTTPSLQLSQVRLVVTEGKHRMVRRMLANCGHGVVELSREKQGMVELGDLPENEFRRLTPEEEVWAQSIVPSNARKKHKK